MLVIQIDFLRAIPFKSTFEQFFGVELNTEIEQFGGAESIPVVFLSIKTKLTERWAIEVDLSEFEKFLFLDHAMH